MENHVAAEAVYRKSVHASHRKKPLSRRYQNVYASEEQTGEYDEWQSSKLLGMYLCPVELESWVSEHDGFEKMM